MEYHSWTTFIDEYRRLNKGPEVKRANDSDLFQKELEDLIKFPFKNPKNRNRRIMRLSAEHDWNKHGRPYYNVHPQMVRSLCKTNLDAIPAEFIELPQDFMTVCFRFAEPVPIQYVQDNTGYGRYYPAEAKNSPIYARSVLFSKYLIEKNEPLIKNLPELAGTYRFVLCIDEGFRQKDIRGFDHHLSNVVQLGAHPDWTIPQAIEHAIQERADDEKEQIQLTALGERLSNLFRIVVSSGFLANTPENNLIVPDILNKDKPAFDEASRRNDEERISQILARAKRRGKFGWNIGTNEMFVSESESPNLGRHSEGTGRELSWSHLRGGHPRAVRYGEGKRKVKVKWFRPTRVRPDLPFKQDNP